MSVRAWSLLYAGVEGRAHARSADSFPGLWNISREGCGTLDNPCRAIDFTEALIQFTLLVVSLSVHEAAHAWSADKLGDPTARSLGRVSLNPAVHVDPIGTIVFPLLAMLSNLPLIGWAKPVPVGIQYLRGNWRQKFMFIAAAGPASNLVLAVGRCRRCCGSSPGVRRPSPRWGLAAGS